MTVQVSLISGLGLGRVDRDVDDVDRVPVAFLETFGFLDFLLDEHSACRTARCLCPRSKCSRQLGRSTCIVMVTTDDRESSFSTDKHIL